MPGVDPHFNLDLPELQKEANWTEVRSISSLGTFRSQTGKILNLGEEKKGWSPRGAIHPIDVKTAPTPETYNFDSISPMAVGAGLWRSLRAHQVYGANTDVGKTIVSTVLCRAVQQQRKRAGFLKPVSTGALDEADDR